MLIEFLELVEHTNISQCQLKNEKEKRIQQHIKTVKENQEVKARYMTMLVHGKEITMEARKATLVEGYATEEVKIPGSVA